jgi:hypothetical protein
MKHLVAAIRAALLGQNWYAALGLALALPDICGYVEDPARTSRHRYASWCNAYLVKRYTRDVGLDGEQYVFLSADDTYALRCALLHEGADDIVNQKARDALDAFVFVAPPPNGTFHCNQVGGKLQLQVDMFCEDICACVEEWLAALPQNGAVNDRLQGLMGVQTWENGVTIADGGVSILIKPGEPSA